MRFWVSGIPIPKQSFRYKKTGSSFINYTPARVKDWSNLVSITARQIMRDRELYAGNIAVELHFSLPTKRRVDLDNLSKNLLDSLNNVVYLDDKQIFDLRITKYVDKENPGVEIIINFLEDYYVPNSN